MTFTSTDVVAKVREIASAQPDFVYEPPERDGPWSTCVYVELSDEQWVGSCLVGRALLALGVGTEILRTANLLADELVAELADSSIIGELGWLTVAQEAQDKGVPWGKVVEHADYWAPGGAA